MRLYIVSYGESGMERGEGIYCLVAEDGEALYSHYCSNISFAKGDLIEHRPNRIKECKNKYGKYEVLFLGDDEMTNDELYKRHQEWCKNHQDT